MDSFCLGHFLLRTIAPWTLSSQTFPPSAAANAYEICARFFCYTFYVFLHIFLFTCFLAPEWKESRLAGLCGLYNSRTMPFLLDVFSSVKFFARIESMPSSEAHEAPLPPFQSFFCSQEPCRLQRYWLSNLHSVQTANKSHWYVNVNGMWHIVRSC